MPRPSLANAEPVSLIIEELGDGGFRVDWESSVRYGELDWDEFIQTQPAAPKLFRVIASKPQHTSAETRLRTAKFSKSSTQTKTT
jgi:hypothetical protein